MLEGSFLRTWGIWYLSNFSPLFRGKSEVEQVVGFNTFYPKGVKSIGDPILSLGEALTMKSPKLSLWPKKKENETARDHSHKTDDLKILRIYMPIYM